MKTVTRLMIVLIGVSFLFAQEAELEGEIIEVKEVPALEGDYTILEVKMQIQDKGLVKAQLGPVWFLEKQVIAGEKIMVKGQYDEEHRLIVRAYKYGKEPYNIRSKEYKPLWVKSQIQEKGLIYNPKKEKMMRGRIEALYIDETSSQMEAVVKSEEGENVRVRFAPEWFLKNRVRVGDELELKGSEVKAREDILILTRELTNIRTKEDIILRNTEGFPDWHEEGEEAKEYIEEPRLQGEK